MTIPGTLSEQATWEFDLAMCELESGTPNNAAEHFTRALTLVPGLQVRPIAAYYLEKIGKPVPPPPSTTVETARRAPVPSAASAKPGDVAPGAAERPHGPETTPASAAPVEPRSPRGTGQNSGSRAEPRPGACSQKIGLNSTRDRTN